MKNKSKNDKQKEKSPEEIEFERLSLFLDKYISNGNLIFKYASIAGITRLRYIKGKDLKKFFTENFNDIKQEILSITNQDIGKEPDLNSLQKFYEINQKHGIFHYLKRYEGDKAKYPKKLLPLKKDFICKKLWNYELNKFPNNQFTVDDAIKNLAPKGKKLIKLFINDHDKKEQKQKMEEEELYVFKHSKPPLNLNPWKFSNHVIEEFSRPKADEIYGYREKKKVKYAYTVEPFRRPKEKGDLFDKHIGIL